MSALVAELRAEAELMRNRAIATRGTFTQSELRRRAKLFDAAADALGSVPERPPITREQIAHELHEGGVSIPADSNLVGGLFALVNGADQ